MLRLISEYAPAATALAILAGMVALGVTFPVSPVARAVFIGIPPVVVLALAVRRMWRSVAGRRRPGARRGPNCPCPACAPLAQRRRPLVLALALGLMIAWRGHVNRKAYFTHLGFPLGKQLYHSGNVAGRTSWQKAHLLARAMLTLSQRVAARGSGFSLN